MTSGRMGCQRGFPSSSHASGSLPLSLASLTISFPPLFGVSSLLAFFQNDAFFFDDKNSLFAHKMQSLPRPPILCLGLKHKLSLRLFFTPKCLQLFRHNPDVPMAPARPPPPHTRRPVLPNTPHHPRPAQPSPTLPPAHPAPALPPLLSRPGAGC